MAKGNWNPEVIKPKTRCRYCGHVIKGTVYRVEGYKPCHSDCAQVRGLEFSSEREIVFNPETMTMATSEDVFRMWRRLWGEIPPNTTLLTEAKIEYLDITQVVI